MEESSRILYKLGGNHEDLGRAEGLGDLLSDTDERVLQKNCSSVTGHLEVLMWP